MKIKIRTAHTHTHVHTHTKVGGGARSQWAKQQQQHQPLAPFACPCPCTCPKPPSAATALWTAPRLVRIACRYLVMSKWSYENVSFVFQVQMSSTDTHTPPSHLPPVPNPPRCWQFCFLLFVCSLAIFMPLLCLLFAFVSANAFKALRLFSL